MPDEITNQLIAEIAKQVPLKEGYEDLASPAAKQVGQTAADIIKVLRLALAPIQYLASVQDRYSNFLRRSVDRVPQERLVTPAPQILGPIMEAIKYEPEGSPVDEMFSHLLSCAMDQDEVAKAHPAFPALVRQLSSDEARIICCIAGNRFERIKSCKYDYNKNLFVGDYLIEVDSFPTSSLTFPQNLNLYIDHLHNLGLAGLYESKRQETIMAKDPRFSDNRSVQIGTRVFQEYMLSPWGKRFYAACSKS